jgi:hypothetical protein
MGQENVFNSITFSQLWEYMMSSNQCCASISFSQIYLLDMDREYYLFFLIFSKLIYFNQMHIQRYI